MKQFAPSTPRSTARLSLSPQPAVGTPSDRQGWCLGLLSIGLVALTLHLGHEPETLTAVVTSLFGFATAALLLRRKV